MGIAMDMQEINEMADRYQITLTLSKKAYEEFALVAKWKETPLATFIRNILEREHDSPAFGNLVKRAVSDVGEASKGEL